jgi:predicted membrane channel-forming protein YqfA (hemolysin III family)
VNCDVPGTTLVLLVTRRCGLLLWIVAGSVLLLFNVGTIPELSWLLDRRVRYFHALWHMFVVAGSICHYVGPE